MANILFFLLITSVVSLSGKPVLKPSTVDHPDTSMNGISLQNPASILKYIGHTPVPIERSNDSFPNIVLFNNDTSERLIIFHHPGSKTNEFSEFYLESVKKDTLKIDGDKSVTTQFTRFTTNNGIQLGTKTSYVTNTFKNCIKLNTKKQVLSIVIVPQNNSPLLKKYNMPEYYANYYFDRHNKVSRISFGFHYP
jgi:hypothetical protein